MYQHHGIALIYKHLHTLQEYAHVLLQVNPVQALLQALFDGDVAMNSHDHKGELHGHYHLQELALRHGVAFEGNVPYKRCRHQTTFPHHVEQLVQIRVACLHVQRYAYHDHHHQRQLLRSMEIQFLWLLPMHCESLQHGHNPEQSVHQLFSSQ